MTALLSPSFWFAAVPPPFIPWVQVVLLVVFTVFTVVGIVAYVIRFRLGLEKLTRRGLERAGDNLITTGLLGLLVVGLTYEHIPYLSMRFLFLVIGSIFVYRVYRLYTYVWIEVPHIKAARQQQQEFNKWLPKKKK